MLNHSQIKNNTESLRIMILSPKYKIVVNTTLFI